MKEVLSVENMRKSDEATIENGIPSKELMYRAAYGIYQNIPFDKIPSPDILVVCGTGNNAGDGYALALILKKNGHRVSLLLLENRFSPDGKYYFDKCQENGISYSLYTEGAKLSYDIIIDCIFGTGFKGEPKDIYKEVIEKINFSSAYIISADINSGLNGDSGMGKMVVKSDLTVSIGSYKSGHFLNMAKDKIGALTNCDIGILPKDKPYYLFDRETARSLLPKRDNFSHKGTYGYITLIGGSYEYSGAIKLANIASSAMRSGAGVVKIATPKSIGNAVMMYLLESTLFPLSEIDGAIKFEPTEIDEALKGVKAVGIGMGMGQRGENKELISYILSNYSLPILLDADALNTLAKMDKEILKNTKCTVILTPHLKELERLSGISLNKIQENPVASAIEFARETGIVLLLKGTSTIVTDGENVRIINTGCAGMATAGSGDVLSGIITALLGQKPNEAFDMVCLGAYINGRAGEEAQKQMGAISMVSSDTAGKIADVIVEIEK
ncbi:MAG: NAD(P)H-hydrate dehydratase [Clostridia bacterium]|nr:NAD(P)H-hydrate dehydratase [Clostridia bacterium]